MALLAKFDEYSDEPADAPAALSLDAYLGPVERIAVFRALGLGDLICATPALRALKHRFPHASITLIGQPWAAAFATRLSSLDGFIAFPGHPDLPEPMSEPDGWPRFLAQTHAHGFDLLLQLHGNGRLSNALVAQMGARHVSAFHEPHRLPPEPVLGLPWPMSGSEAQRLLGLIQVFGVAPHADDLKLEFPLRPGDWQAAQARMRLRGKLSWVHRPYVIIHAGAQLPSRRWPVERFALVAQALQARGYAILLTGTAAEAGIGSQLEAALGGPCVNLVGQTSLWTLGALIQRAALLVCNDTGVSHIAAALGTRSVVISCGADVARWSPAHHGLHRVLWSDQPCRPCGDAVCPHQHECAMAVEAAEVIDATQTMLPEAA